MEATPRPPAISDLPTGADRNLGRLSFGAIASPMAVSFREEKLAMGATQSDFDPSAESPVTHFGEAERVA